MVRMKLLISGKRFVSFGRDTERFLPEEGEVQVEI